MNEIANGDELKQKFEMSMDMFVSATPEAHLEGILATLSSYRDFMQKNLQQAGPVDPTTFVRWMESAERNPDDYPEPWGAVLVETFDRRLIEAVRDDNRQPAEVLEALDEWVEDSKAEVREIHDLPEDAFDV